LNCSALEVLRARIVSCTLCPRLVEYREQVAQEKRRAYRDWTYWGKPVPPFGDADAKLFVLGLAPAAHGGNRTGRMFTGDRSGDFLYRALYKTGFASQPHSVSRDDGMRLTGAYISATARCAPPGNKPLPQELRNCRPYLEQELDLLTDLRVVVALGRIAFDAYLTILRDGGIIKSRGAFPFGHNVEHRIAHGQPVLLASYHPSQQNTSTGKLTDQMLTAVFRRARAIIDRSRARS
jgi:uracil-DNA glycosylase family 4